MNRFHHRDWTARLSDYLSDELSEADERVVEEHLATCEACRDALDGLARVVDEAEALGPIEPPTDLWPGIAAAIAVGVAPKDDDVQVIAFPGTHSGPESRPAPERHVQLSRRGLVAASVVLVALTGTAWLAGRATVPDPSPSATLAPIDVVSAVGSDAGAPEAMAGELAVLEDVLASARAVLDPNTVRVLERNLGVIEQAIADSREALAQDPGNSFLAQHLERMYRRKLVYLQDAVRLVEFGG